MFPVIESRCPEGSRDSVSLYEVSSWQSRQKKYLLKLHLLGLDKTDENCCFMTALGLKQGIKVLCVGQHWQKGIKSQGLE